MQILAALVLCLALVLAPYTVKVELGAAGSSLPWKTFSESAKDTLIARPGACSNGEIVVKAQLVYDGTTFMYYTTDTGRFIFAKMGADRVPEVIYIGQSLPSPRQDEINVLDEHPYSEERDGSDPCADLFPVRS